ncbi:MAG: polysaccharide biosynthesis/export family protein [Planctomycetaceae bacterium]
MIRAALLLLLVAGAACASRRDARPDVGALVTASKDRVLPPRKLHVEVVETELPQQVDEYRIGINDTLNVLVFGHPEFTGGPATGGTPPGVRVQKDGNIYLPMLEEVGAAGSTTVELQTRLRERLTKFLKDPHVTVDVAKHESQKFYILGYVERPGVFPVDGDTTLLEGLSLAGGIKEGGDIEGAYVVRASALLPISLGDMLLRGDLRRNVFMRHGDFVYVPSASDWKVFVLGEVRQPGAVPMPQAGLNLAAAVAAAGGIDPVYASRYKVHLYRGSWQRPERYTIGIEDVYHYGLDIQLRPGDRIVVGVSGLGNYQRMFNLLLPFLQLPVASGAAANALGGG